jgi:simple sugar transport system permease protein
MYDIIASVFTAAVLAGAPLLFGTVGEIVTQKSGSLNLGVEGLMYIGAICGFAAGYFTGNAALALVAAFAGGMAGSLIFAFLTVTLGANQNVTGLTLTVFGTGLANYIGDALIANSAAKSVALAVPLKNAFKPLSIPFLSDLPYVGKLLFQFNIFVYIGIIIAIAVFIYLNKTRAGLNLRAIGENPYAADAAGVSVTRSKYLHITIGGGICALGGAYIAIITCGGSWVHNCVNGQGWIAVALVIFASWSPLRAMLGSLVFGALVILRFYVSGGGMPNAVWMMIPFIVTCAVLIVSSVKQSREHMQPAFCGVNYDREQR